MLSYSSTFDIEKASGHMALPGHFITFEGLDGCGKSTQLSLAAEYLRSRKINLIATHEPGGTEIGNRIRELVLNAESGQLASHAELALMFAARAQHVEKVIVPGLRGGAIVLCDRFTDSTTAYQGYGRGISLDVIRDLDRLLSSVRPDRTFIFDIDAETSAQRTGSRNKSLGQQPTRFEMEGARFFERVRQGYQAIAREEPDRVRVIDGTRSIEEVQREVRQYLEEVLRVAPSATLPRNA